MSCENVLFNLSEFLLPVYKSETYIGNDESKKGICSIAAGNAKVKRETK